jgi:hypothetical protein
MGETGSGKTTWINGIANYLYSVQWTDDFRFKAVTEGDEAGSLSPKAQSESQTDFITTYKFMWQPGFPCDFHVLLTDTPGFADTRGLERDNDTVIQLKNLFEMKGPLRLDQLDAIAFVVKASDVRLTATQKYVFDAVLKVFGKDIVKNMLIIATFADGREAQVKHAIDAGKVQYHTLLTFNNSALFKCNSSETDDFAASYWRFGVSSYQELFTSLYSMCPQSLLLTREVLRERESLHATIQGIHQLIANGIAELDKIKQERQMLEQCKLDIEANHNFTKTISVQRAEQIHSPPGLFVTNCIVCNMTCHKGCTFKNNSDKKYCYVMNCDGHCTICSKKCMWHEHENQLFYWQMKIVTETVTLEKLKAKYMDAKSKETTIQAMLATMQQAYNRIKQDLAAHVEEARKHVNRLGEIAARPDPLSSADYINLLIQSEQSKKKPGWQVRINHLREVKEEDETSHVIRTPGGFMPKQWSLRPQ